MTRDDIIRMAREAGAFIELSTTLEKDLAFLSKFAAFVAAAEREAIARIIENEKACAICGFSPKMVAAAIRARGQG